RTPHHARPLARCLPAPSPYPADRLRRQPHPAVRQRVSRMTIALRLLAFWNVPPWMFVILGAIAPPRSHGLHDTVDPSRVRRALISARVVEAEYAALLVIGENLGIARPGDHRAQRALRLLLRHVVFELVAEPARRRATAGALVQHAPDVAGERHI